MKPEDRLKLNQCIDILESTDLGLPLVWLWTWDTIKYNMQDDSYKCTVTEEQMWDHLCEAVAEGMGFSLEYGADQCWEDIHDWMIDNDYIVDLEAENEDTDI